MTGGLEGHSALNQDRVHKDPLGFNDAPHSPWFPIGAGSVITRVGPALEWLCIMRWLGAEKTSNCTARILRSVKRRVLPVWIAFKHALTLRCVSSLQSTR